MPIDFRQIAAPSFSDSNTLVALAAKQQQEAMAGIQGAWTGAMDAVGNRVQGEMEGIANQASFSQLTDPVQRAALDQQIMAANTLGMGDVREINKYTDNRRGVQLGLIEDVNRVDTAARVEADTVEEKRINDSSRYLANIYTQMEAEEDKDKRGILEQVGNQYLKDQGFSDTQQAKITQLAGQHNQKQRLADLDELTKRWGPAAAEAMVNANNQNTYASEANVAMAIDKHMNGGKGNALATKRKYADSLELQGAFKDDGTPNYDVLKQSLDNRIARSAIEQQRVDPDNMSYDEYLIKNSDLMEKKLGSFGRKTDVKGLQAHFQWAEENGVPYPEREKILITEGFLTGSIKMNLFTDNFFDGARDGAGNLRIKEAIAKTHLPRVETEFNTTRMQAGQDAFDPIIKLLTSEGVPPDQILTNLGITSLDHPQAKYLPENMKKALEVLEVSNREAYMDSTPDGTGFGKTRRQIAADEAPKIELDARKLTGIPNTNQEQYKGPLRNTNTPTTPATTTTEDLVAVGKANNVGTTSPATKPTTTSKNTKQASKPKPVSKTTDNGYVIPSNARTITGRNGSKQYEYLPITTSVAKNLGLKLNSKGDIVMPPNRKNEVAYDVYGGKWTLKDAETYKQFTGINNSGQAKDKVKKGIAFINGTSKYRPPQRRLKTPDLKHPLAHKLSDDPNNFVPYDERNPDGSPKQISKVKKKKYGKFNYKDAYTNFSK